MIEGISSFFQQSALLHVTFGNIVMFCVAGALLYVAIAKDSEPLLLIPIAFGMILANIPPEYTKILNEGGLLWYIRKGLDYGIYPPLIFLGIGALTDFSFMLSYPITIFLGGAAQVGIFTTFALARKLGFTLKQAASIGIIGGADGPTSIYITTKFSPELLSAIAIAAYSYIALIPILPIVTTVVTALLVPQALPLIGMLMFGNVLREAGVVRRLVEAASRYVLDTVTILLMLSVGASARADIFLTTSSLKIFALGAGAFVTAMASGILFAKLMNLFLKNKLNPLIGAAGVSAVPDSARVAQKIAQGDDPTNFILMHAMGPNVAGVIGSAVAAGVFLSLIQ